MSTTSRLVDDLIPLILETRGDSWTTREYLRLTLVSPSWRHYVQKRLYAFPTLQTLNSCALLARTLVENPVMAKLIKGIELRPRHNLEEKATGQHFEAIQLLLGLENLKRLALGGLLATRAERFLNAVAFPETIAELAIEGDVAELESFAGASLDISEDFWYRFTSVKTLKLVNLRVEVDSSPRPPLSLNHAILTNIACGSLCELLAGMSLDLLSIHSECTCEHPDLQQVLQDPDLCEVKALRFSLSKGCRDSDGSFLHGPPAPTLRSLHLDEHFIQQDIFDTLADYPCLEELALGGRFIAITSMEWAQFISSGALPNLQRLRLPGGTCGPPYRRWLEEEIHDLQACCSSRRIQLLG